MQVTPTQIARRSDALYSDGSYGVTRRVLCDMVARREAEIEDLRTLCADLWQRARLTVPANTRAYWMGRMSALGMEVPDA